MAALPMKCRKYLAERGLAYDEVEEGGQRGIVLRAMPLPPGRFDATVADILIMLPPGYPDVAPDMFYAMPWLRLVATSSYARCADVPFTFVAQTWQRWSRHSTDWRPGRDGIWTMIKRVEAALELAA
jgi:hypothetical protein